MIPAAMRRCAGQLVVVVWTTTSTKLVTTPAAYTA